MIILDNVSKSFKAPGGRKIILDQASFMIPAGLTVGIQAPNGAGKSTLINMLAGIEKPDSGRVITEGRVSPPLGHTAGLSMTRSGYANANTIAIMNRCDPCYVQDFVCWMTDLGDDMGKNVGKWSAGMRSRFSLALMLAMDFDIYLLDEGLPTTLDRDFNARAEKVLSQKLRQATAVIVSHQMDVIAKFCTATSQLTGGKLSPLTATP
jgi:capsular polysaccharide transport system ATP-binding protein